MNRGDRLIVNEVAAQAVSLGQHRLHDMYKLANETYNAGDWDTWYQAFLTAIAKHAKRPRRNRWLTTFVQKIWSRTRST